MGMCSIHKHYSGQFCTECKDGPHSAKYNGYRPFNEDRALGQNQYASRYADGRHGSDDLGSDLRWIGDTSDYHDLYIHVDDYDVFHKRVLEHQAKRNEDAE